MLSRRCATQIQTFPRLPRLVANYRSAIGILPTDVVTTNRADSINRLQRRSCVMPWKVVPWQRLANTYQDESAKKMFSLRLSIRENRPLSVHGICVSPRDSRKSRHLICCRFSRMVLFSIIFVLVVSRFSLLPSL